MAEQTTDRELLELAAKAAGIPISFSPEGLAFTPSYHDPRGRQWNPLVNDGYALRLAVAVGVQAMIILEVGRSGASVEFDNDVECVLELGDDVLAATRRAIVRAAAALARPVPAHSPEGE